MLQIMALWYWVAISMVLAELACIVAAKQQPLLLCLVQPESLRGRPLDRIQFKMP